MSDAGINTETVEAFLESYASVFQRSDKEAVADRYAYPVHVVTHNGGVRVVNISPLVAQASLVWDLRGEGDKPLYKFEATYTLALFDGELKIVQVISENEQPKFMGVMRERG